MMSAMNLSRALGHGALAAAWWGLYALLWRAGWAPWNLDLMFLALVPLLLLFRRRPLALLSALGIITAAASRSGKRPGWLWSTAYSWPASWPEGRWIEAAALRPGRRKYPLDGRPRPWPFSFPGLSRRAADLVHGPPGSAARTAGRSLSEVPGDAPRNFRPWPPGYEAMSRRSPPAWRALDLFPENQNLARDYVAKELAAAGYQTRLQEYASAQTDFSPGALNVEAV